MGKNDLSLFPFYWSLYSGYNLQTLIGQLCICLIIIIMIKIILATVIIIIDYNNDDKIIVFIIIMITSYSIKFLGKYTTLLKPFRMFLRFWACAARCTFCSDTKRVPYMTNIIAEFSTRAKIYRFLPMSHPFTPMRTLSQTSRKRPALVRCTFLLMWSSELQSCKLTVTSGGFR